MKMGLTGAGACNALAMHLTAWCDVDAWGRRARVPAAVRATAVASVLVWLGMITLGRAMGYERREPPTVDFELDWFAAADRGRRRQMADAGGESIHSTGRVSRR